MAEAAALPAAAEIDSQHLPAVRYRQRGESSQAASGKGLTVGIYCNFFLVNALHSFDLNSKTEGRTPNAQLFIMF